jgi:carboxymethylenebutenolidase
LDHPGSNGKVGDIGFCFGGGFDIILSAGYGFDSTKVNYGSLTKNAYEELKNACPIVESYGAKDRKLKGTADRLKKPFMITKWSTPSRSIKHRSCIHECS